MKNHRPMIFIISLIVIVVFFAALRLGRSTANTQIKILEKLIEKKTDPTTSSPTLDPINLLDLEKKQLGCGISLLLPKDITQKLKLEKTDVFVGEKLFLTYSCDENFVKSQNSEGGTETSEISLIRFDKYERDGKVVLISDENKIYLSFPPYYLDTVKSTLTFEQITPIDNE